MISLSFRQTNIIWVTVFMALAIIDIVSLDDPLFDTVQSFGKLLFWRRNGEIGSSFIVSQAPQWMSSNSWWSRHVVAYQRLWNGYFSFVWHYWHSWLFLFGTKELYSAIVRIMWLACISPNSFTFRRFFLSLQHLGSLQMVPSKRSCIQTWQGNVERVFV